MRIIIVAVALALGGCGRAAEQPEGLDRLDAELTDNALANERDPAVASALRDQIMVDPALTQQSNANVIRPPSRPDPHMIPPEAIGAKPDGVAAASLKAAPVTGRDCPECRARKDAFTLGALAGQQRGIGGCAAKVAYSATWANRLPADLPLYPDARLSEAAGTDADGCALRIASFRSNAPVARVVDWYNARATRAGYSAEHRAEGGVDVLGGTRGGAAFVLYVSRYGGGGSEVDLVVNAVR